MARLTDVQLAAEAKAYQDLQAQVAELKKQQSAHSKKIVAEFKARKKSELVLSGLKIAILVTRRTVYNPDKARKQLPPAQYRRLARTVIPAETVKAEIKAGLLTEDQALAFATVTDNAAYPDVKAA